jgi:non-ribosomal peptide synthetase component F
MMAIQMVGGVYCPLSSRDPKHRLQALLQQTQSHLVLIHHLTRSVFVENIILLEISSVLTNKNVESNINISRLSNLLVTHNNIAYIIFTSGSTGIPKPVCSEMKLMNK